ncbi:histidine kinase [Streptomyces sp. NPDC012950]|uniref:histidine kinase n=1 Tax=Streptomyces sp. NPDC012950 TaxID=3364858 RepID=UPI0036C83F67
MAVISVQSGLARFVFDSDPATARAALDTISDTGTEALDELRRMLTLLRGGTDPRTGPPHARSGPSRRTRGAGRGRRDARRADRRGGPPPDRLRRRPLRLPRRPGVAHQRPQARARRRDRGRRPLRAAAPGGARHQ